jgi:antitoxin component of MazEF toxin-antitoxin module
MPRISHATGRDTVTHAIIGRWGKNLALRFPNEIAGKLSLREGDRLEIEAGPDQIVIRRAKPHYTLEEMFAGKSPAEWREIYADAYDWGPDVGREIVDE